MKKTRELKREIAIKKAHFLLDRIESNVDKMISIIEKSNYKKVA